MIESLEKQSVSHSKKMINRVMTSAALCSGYLIGFMNTLKNVSTRRLEE